MAPDSPSPDGGSPCRRHGTCDGRDRHTTVTGLPSAPVQDAAALTVRSSPAGVRAPQPAAPARAIFSANPPFGLSSPAALTA